MEHPFTGLRDMQRCSLITILAILSGALTATSAKAEAARTWVSGAGDDMSQSCSRTEPCRTFNRALLETEAGGEISCLNPGEYGAFALRIVKSVTIDCEGSFGAVRGAADQIAINISGADVVVTLRNLTIKGVRQSFAGVSFSEGSVLRIQNCNIFGFQTGVLFRPLAVAKLFIENTTISENDTGITIVPAPFGMSPTGRGGADVSVNKIRVQNNTAGILLDGGFGHIKIAMQESEVSGNTKNGIHAKTTNHPVRVTADRIMSVNNDVGILSEGARARVTLNYSMITGNRANLAKISRGALESYKTNSIDDDTPGETGLLIVPIH